MFILVDDKERENEGDLVIPAQMATPDAINFMATHGRGLICLALTRQRIEELNLSPMSQNNTTRHETAFTISIEAKEGVTTGISASDRAKTIAVAINASRGSQDICTPGHVFPLASRDGGVLVRAGHTEAAVDISRLSGLNPAGVVCEIMNDDGTMARMPNLIPFAQKHSLRIATIADLIAYRLRNDRIIKVEVESKLQTIVGGEFRSIVYKNTAELSEHMALVKGDLLTLEPVLVRMHSFNMFDDIYSAEKSLELHRAMEMIAAEGRGVVVMIRSASTTFLSDRIRKITETKEIIPPLLKEYGVGAQILSDLGVREMILLSNTKRSLVGLEGHDLKIVEQRPIKFSREHPIPVRSNFYG